MLITLLQRNVDNYPAAPAIVFGGLQWTHDDLLNRVQRLAQGLKQAGVMPGDRVALFQQNNPDFIACFFSVVACGAINVPVSPESKAEELKFYLETAGVSWVIADEHRLGIAHGAARSLKQAVGLISTASASLGALAMSELLANDGTQPLGYGQLDDDVVYLHSSGSLGRPKCVPRTAIQYWWEADIMSSMLRLTSSDVIFCAIPLFHNYGLVECMLAAASSGAKLVILENPTPFILRRKKALKLLESERVTIFPSVPFLIKHLLDSSADADLSSMRLCYTAAAVLPPEIFDGFLEKYGVPVRQHYGCAEVGAMTINVDDDPRPSSLSTGRAFPGVQIRIVDEEDRDLPLGESGEVIVSSRAMTRGYLGMGDLNDTAFRDGFFRTGDLGRLDAEGRLTLLGRKKFVIDIAGHKVDPVEVEDALNQHPLIQECVVIDVADSSGNDNNIVAYVVPTAQCNPEELIAFCRDRLANFKVPRFVEFIRTVPRDDLGKVLRKKDVLERSRVADSA